MVNSCDLPPLAQTDTSAPVPELGLSSHSYPMTTIHLLSFRQLFLYKMLLAHDPAFSEEQQRQLQVSSRDSSVFSRFIGVFFSRLGHQDTHLWLHNKGAQNNICIIQLTQKSSYILLLVDIYQILSPTCCSDQSPSKISLLTRIHDRSVLIQSLDGGTCQKVGKYVRTNS